MRRGETGKTVILNSLDLVLHDGHLEVKGNVTVVDAILDGRLHNPTVVAGALAAWTALQRDGFESLRSPDAPWPARDSLRAS